MFKKLAISCLNLSSLLVCIAFPYIRLHVSQYVSTTYDASKLLIPFLWQIAAYAFLVVEGGLALRFVRKFSPAQKGVGYLLISKAVLIVCATVYTGVIFKTNLAVMAYLFPVIAPFLAVNLLTVCWLFQYKADLSAPKDCTAKDA